MKTFSQSIYLILLATFIFASCSSESLTDEQAIDLFRAEAEYPKKGRLWIGNTVGNSNKSQELDRLVEAGFLIKDSKGNFTTSKKHDDFYFRFDWDKFRNKNDIAIYPYLMDVAKVRDRRNIDNNTLEIVFELKVYETPEFIEFRKIAPTIVEGRQEKSGFFGNDGFNVHTHTPGEVVLKKIVFNKWEKGWRVDKNTLDGNPPSLSGRG